MLFARTTTTHTHTTTTHTTTTTTTSARVVVHVVSLLLTYVDIMTHSHVPHTPPFKATNLSAVELVAYVTGQGSSKGGIPRLGVPPHPEWGAESLHGLCVACPFPDRCTTVFPPASATAKSFNRTLWRAVGAALGMEARTLFNIGLNKALTVRGPQLNLQRDPR